MQPAEAILLAGIRPFGVGEGKPPSDDTGEQQDDEQPDLESAGPSPRALETGPAESPPVSIERRSPTGALLRSAVLPGWGQFYNGEEVKGLILGSVEIGLAVWLVLEHLAAEDARKDYQESGDPADQSRYELHSQRRLDLIWYTSGAWLYGMLDAYVGAHLYAFEEENRDFERKVGIGVGVSFRF